MKNRYPQSNPSIKMHVFLAAVFTLAFAFASIPTASAEGFAVIKKIPIAGQGSWDYLAVDEGGRRLYVSHGTKVEVPPPFFFFMVLWF